MDSLNHIFAKGTVIFIELGKHTISCSADGTNTFEVLVRTKLESDRPLHERYCEMALERAMEQMDYSIPNTKATLEYHH